MATLPPADSQNEDPEKRAGNRGNSQSPDLSNSSSAVELPHGDQKIILKATDKACQGNLATDFSWKLKILYLLIVFLVQVSMNFNTTLYSNAIGGIANEFNTSEDAARWGAAGFLIAYAFGCELWAPWSEEYGRRWVLQLSLLLVNIWGVVVAVAPNLATVLIGRILGGLSTAGGSVTLAVITDLYHHNDHGFQHATAFIVFSSVAGSLFGPIIGGFMLEHGLNWIWFIWVQVIFGFATQILHFICVKETRATVLMDSIAKQKRKEGSDIWGPGEEESLTIRSFLSTVVRPFTMFFTEPIVLCFSLLSGFSDALIFMMIQSLEIIYEQWEFTPSQNGLVFVALLIGYCVAYALCYFAIKNNTHKREANPDYERWQYEDRLRLLLWTAPLLPIGLFAFAFTACWSDPPFHWIWATMTLALIGIANFSIYMCTIDYVLRAYGVYAASATGGNGWARDFLAGVLTPVAIPMYTQTGSNSTFNAIMILFGISLLLVLCVYFIYFKGETLRRNSKFAMTLLTVEKENEGDAPLVAVPQALLPGSQMVSRLASANTSRVTSRNPSRPSSPRPGQQPGEI